MLRIDGTCGKESDIIVTLRYDKKKEAIERILQNAKIKKSLSQLVFELTLRNFSFRLYESGKIIFRDVKNKEELNQLLIELLSG